MSEKATYAAAGVDVKEGARAVELMKKHVKETYNGNVLGDLGNFGGLLRLSGEFQNPVLVAGTDGVGTKLKLAFMMDRHDTVGQDLVAMCVNDILCQGATPLFFLDYMATGKLQAEKAAEIVSGIAKACKLSQMPLLGGETAEMPGFYSDGEYDLAGFAVGVVDEKHVVTGKDIKPGDLLIGLESSGIHSNGYSLVRHVIFDKMGFSPETVVDELGGKVGDQLLTPTRIYVSSILKLL
jgi:phosphoribosylformylglycinamidine cyclo-ligase